MKVTKYICDRCRKETEKAYRIIIKQTGASKSESESWESSQDICEDCRKEIIAYIQPEKQEPAKKEEIKGKAKLTNCTDKVKTKCQYGARQGGTWICDYMAKEGHRRGCPHEKCDKYKGKPGRRRTKSEIVGEGKEPEAAESQGQQLNEEFPVEE
jgi:hypothetical protein